MHSSSHLKVCHVPRTWQKYEAIYFDLINIFDSYKLSTSITRPKMEGVMDEKMNFLNSENLLILYPMLMWLLFYPMLMWLDANVFYHYVSFSWVTHRYKVKLVSQQVYSDMVLLGWLYLWLFIMTKILLTWCQKCFLYKDLSESQ